MEDWAITQFRGDYRFLSNFYAAPLQFNGITFPTVEHAFQAAKAVDPDERDYIASLESPVEARKAGKSVKLRDNWDEIKYGAMYLLVKKKFEDRNLRRRLTLTRQAYLIEGNSWHDTYWGQCTCDKHDMTGQNKLGEILMQIRTVCANLK